MAGELPFIHTTYAHANLVLINLGQFLWYHVHASINLSLMNGKWFSLMYHFMISFSLSLMSLLCVDAQIERCDWIHTWHSILNCNVLDSCLHIAPCWVDVICRSGHCINLEYLLYPGALQIIPQLLLTLSFTLCLRFEFCHTRSINSWLTLQNVPFGFSLCWNQCWGDNKQ